MPGELSDRIAKIKWLMIMAGFFSIFPAPSRAETLPEPPPDAVLMFVAAWCAPCLTELARFDALAAAARPRRLMIVAVDEGPRSREMTRRFANGQKLVVAPQEAWAMLRRLSGGRGTGLPYAVMTDGRGRPCATRNQGLTEGGLQAMAANCGP